MVSPHKIIIAHTGLVGFLALVAGSVVAASRKAATDPAIAPVAHATSLTATIMVWSNWITALMAVPLGILCILYYMAVLYESKMYLNFREWLRSRKAAK